MPTEAPRPGGTDDVVSGTASQKRPPPEPDQAHLLEELAQVEHELETLAEYRKQLREKIEGTGVSVHGTETRMEADDAG